MKRKDFGMALIADAVRYVGDGRSEASRTTDVRTFPARSDGHTDDGWTEIGTYVIKTRISHVRVYAW